MNISAKRVCFDDDEMWVYLADGRAIRFPLARFPRLMAASPEVRSQVVISAYGLHWEMLDEDLSLQALLAELNAMK